MWKAEKDDDEDLEALRLNALASLKTKKPPVVSRPAPTYYAQPKPRPNNIFQRHHINSNLIAIVPISDDVLPVVKPVPVAPALILPQDRYCKTDVKPVVVEDDTKVTTKFNRYDKSSSSEDSDQSESDAEASDDPDVLLVNDEDENSLDLLMSQLDDEINQTDAKAAPTKKRGLLEKEGPPFRRLSPDRKQNSPPRRTSSPVRRQNSPNRRSSPPRRFNSPPRRLNSPPPRRLNSPPRRLNSPPRRLNSPPRRLNTPPRRLNSPQRRLNSPPRRLNSPPRRLNSPPRRAVSPARRNSPPRRLRSPKRSRSSSRTRSPRRRSRSPIRNRSPLRARSPLRLRSPVRGRSRSPESRIQSPGRQRQRRAAGNGSSPGRRNPGSPWRGSRRTSPPNNSSPPGRAGSVSLSPEPAENRVRKEPLRIPPLLSVGRKVAPPPAGGWRGAPRANGKAPRKRAADAPDIWSDESEDGEGRFDKKAASGESRVGVPSFTSLLDAKKPAKSGKIQPLFTKQQVSNIREKSRNAGNVSASLAKPTWKPVTDEVTPRVQPASDKPPRLLLTNDKPIRILATNDKARNHPANERQARVVPANDKPVRIEVTNEKAAVRESANENATGNKPANETTAEAESTNGAAKGAESDLRTELKRRRAERLNKLGSASTEPGTRLVQSAIMDLVGKKPKKRIQANREAHSEERRVSVINHPKDKKPTGSGEAETKIPEKPTIHSRLGKPISIGKKIKLKRSMQVTLSVRTPMDRSFAGPTARAWG